MRGEVMIRKIRLTYILLLMILSACAGAPGNQQGGNTGGSPLEPIPGEESMMRSEVTITSSQLLIMESYPLQITIDVSGTLSTPCHYLRAEVQEPDKQNAIYVEVYSLVDPNEICVQVIESFDTNIPLGSYPDGAYTVYLNGEYLGEFEQ